MYKAIINFAALVNRAVQKNEKNIRMSVGEASKLNAELTELLIELKQKSNSSPNTYDGGKF